MSNVEMKPIYFDREQRPVRKKERIENVFDCFSGIRVWLEKRVKKIADLHWKINFQKAAKKENVTKYIVAYIFDKIWFNVKSYNWSRYLGS